MKFIKDNGLRSVYFGEDGDQLTMTHVVGEGVVLSLISYGEVGGAELSPAEAMELRDVLCAFNPLSGARSDYKMRDRARCKFASPEGVEFLVHYTNRGEPFREGLSFGICDVENQFDVAVFLQDRELVSMRDALVSYYPIKAPVAA